MLTYAISVMQITSSVNGTKSTITTNCQVRRKKLHPKGDEERTFFGRHAAAIISFAHYVDTKHEIISNNSIGLPNSTIGFYTDEHKLCKASCLSAFLTF